ncbi:MAG TPA: hypothetical protein VMZ03_04720 [Chitinophagaceae bacterium]|nr:hypothetical protein [Chitinophagaceae bacterium]
MDEAKIRLSPKEMDLVTNAEWILTKNSILQKIAELLGQFQSQYSQILETLPELPEEVRGTGPKISKGENFRGLPYLVLDYPRRFDQQDVFAVRTLFWWGNFFSITLHLSGKYKKAFEGKIISSLPLLRQKDFFLCINEDQWQHHFEKDNYLPLHILNDEAVQKHLEERSFVKIASRLSLEEWDKSLSCMLVHFRTIMELLLN